jgi:hypothetical protein
MANKGQNKNENRNLDTDKNGPSFQPSCECSNCCGASSDEGKESQSEAYVQKTGWIVRRLDTAVGPIPVVATRLGWRDRIGIRKVRLGIGRMKYRIRPGLYGVGKPSAGSPVFVSANYKLSFDALRRELDGLDAWALVLDTRGINVWCAAGKGTFGTDELVRRIDEVGLARVVSHRTLILPQLGAPGVAAHEVTKQTKFKVVYGPVRAADIKEFLNAGMKATPEMRRVRFNFRDRIALTTVELVEPIKYYVIIAAVLWFLNIFGLKVFSWRGLYPYLGAILVGSFLVPALLPWIPGRAFALKGWLLGMAWALFVNIHQGWILSAASNWPRAAVHFLLLPAISAFLAMTFTGSSTYTSLSGVVKEMKYAVPAILLSAGFGLILLIVVLAGAF